MNREISKILMHLINKYYNSDDNTDLKYLTLEVYNDPRFDDGNGNIRINACGEWIKNFDPREFQGLVWNHRTIKRKRIFVRKGNKKINHYDLVKMNIGDISTLHLEQEPYVQDCEYYVSFVFEIHKRTLQNKFPVIKNYVKYLADKYKDLRIKVIGSDELWEEDILVQRCIKLIGESISTISTYGTINDCRDLVPEASNITTKAEAIEKFTQMVSGRILDYRLANI